MTQAEKNYIWYRLAGKSEQAMLRVLEIDRNGEQVSEQEKRGLAERLGYFFPVAQHGPDYSYAVFPAVFGHPFSQKDEFYLRCPIGPRKDAPDGTHFVPEDGKTLTEREEYLLEMALFPPQGASIPIIEREPIPFTPAPPKPPAGLQP